jgi:hypothetical protein
MGEAKRRRQQDPSYGKPKLYMSYLELPYTQGLVTNQELKEMISSLKQWISTHQVYATVIKDHTGRWKKIEKLCCFIGMQKLLNHNKYLYNTSSVFVTQTFKEDDRNRLIQYYTTQNTQGFPAPSIVTKDIVEKGLENSQEIYEQFLQTSDIEIIYKSNNCTAFHIPSQEPKLQGLNYVEFFTKLQF